MRAHRNFVVFAIASSLSAGSLCAQPEPARVGQLPAATAEQAVEPKVRSEVQLPGRVLGVGDRAVNAPLQVENLGMAMIRGALDIETPPDLLPRAPAHYIVRFSTTDMVAARAELEAAGAEPLEYLPDAAWVVRMSGKTSQVVGALPSVEWLGLYLPEYKESPALRSYRVGPAPAPATVGVEYRGSHGKPIEVEEPPSPEAPLAEGQVRNLTLELRLFPAADRDSAAAAIQAAGGIVLETSISTEGRTELRIAIDPSSMDQLLDVEEIQLVDLALPFRLRNDMARTLMKAASLDSRGLTGEGQIIGHADSGLDVGVMSELHLDLRARLKKAIPKGRKDAWNDEGGHGTHTAGSIVGDGTASNGLYRGVAPKAQLVHQALADGVGSLSGIPVDVGLLLEEAYLEGARIHSDSWGIRVTDYPQWAGAYRNGEQVDRWVWNAGVPKDMLVVLAAGNDGALGAGSVGAPATAKNGLSVGATENNRPTLGADGTQMAPFSSQGFAKGQRYKPDVVAPGTWIVSARTRGDTHLLEDGFEAGAGTWTTLPAGSAWTIVNNQCPSGQGCWAASPGVSYPPGLDTFLISPWVKGSAAATVVFRARWRHVEPDALGVSVLFDSGSGFKSGYRLEPQNRNWPRWDYVVFPVPARARGNSKLRVAFRLQSDSSGGSDGFFLDDVQITTFGSWSFLSSAGMAMAADGLDSAYTLSGGTSMATPLAAGAAALVRQYLQQVAGGQPSAEVVKAVLINGAQRLHSGLQRPDPASGWGRIDIEDSLFPAAPRRMLFLDRQAIGASQLVTIPLVVATSSEELRATLVWADPAGESLVHDLDLTLVDPSGARHFMRGATPGSHDSQNNVEGVDVTAPVSGSWKVEVRSSLLQVPSQPFALVISGALALP